MVTFYNITLSTAFSLLMLSVAEAARPNVVLINTDDLGWAEVGCYGQKKIKTPNIDKLASEGQRWVYFYSGAPVCSPSRNVLMTGKHTGNCDVQDLKRVDAGENWRDLKGDWPIRTETYTLPEAMKKAGYATAVFGKWGIGDFGSTGAPDKHGVDRFYGYTDQKACHTYYPPYLWNDGKKEVLNTSLTAATIGHGSQPKGEVLADTYRAEQHSSDLIADKMLEFVKEKAHGKQPFFLYYAPLEPHVAMQPLQEWIDRYPREWDKSPYRGNRGYLPHPRPRAAYAGMISQMDHNVGRLLDTLKACGLDKNTIVIFTSDNGTTRGSTMARSVNRRAAGLASVPAASAPPCRMGWPPLRTNSTAITISAASTVEIRNVHRYPMSCCARMPTAGPIAIANAFIVPYNPMPAPM